jgi:hypothetical protein
MSDRVIHSHMRHHSPTYYAVRAARLIAASAT